MMMEPTDMSEFSRSESRSCQLVRSQSQVKEFEDAEFEERKTEFFAFYNLDMKKDKHLLDDFGTMKQWKQKML